jgi:hypothetical protein
MSDETICHLGTTFVRRLILESNEATPWHVDPFHRVTVVVRGGTLVIEYRDGGRRERVDVHAGQCDLDQPTDRAHRAVNVGATTYEEVTIFFLDRPESVPQPNAD